jgi:16S rRNA (cytosine967-C5)-methyltransferase
LTTPARRLAIELVAAAEERGATLADRLAGPEPESLDSRDRAFLHELALGTLRHRGLLDHALARVADRPLGRLEPNVLAALRVGAYQLLRLRVPHRAAVSESVSFLRERNSRATGFANAVLRRLAREGPPALPDSTQRPLEWLTTEGSLPKWLAARWMERLGPGPAVERARALLRPPPVTLRLNPRVPLRPVDGDHELTLKPGLVPGAWRVERGRPWDSVAAGAAYVQDEGSQMVGRLAAQGSLVLDACAAPGGKALLIGDALPEGHVIAAEESGPRLRTLAALVTRWMATNVHPVGADALQPPFRVMFETVLLDAPCSGLGTLARNPDIRWRTRPESLERHARRQLDLLLRLADVVRRGGRLVYATCSGEPEENERVVETFLAARPDFAPSRLPGWCSPFAIGPFARTLPELTGGDAIFAAPLERK